MHGQPRGSRWTPAFDSGLNVFSLMFYSGGGDCPRSLSALPCQLANGVEGVVDVADLGPGDAAPAVAVGQQFQFFKVGRRFQALSGAGPQGTVGQGPGTIWCSISQRVRGVMYPSSASSPVRT